MKDPWRGSLGGLSREFPSIDLGEFRLDEFIGEGSMGEVWRAHHVTQRTEVAVKMILTEQAKDDRFLRAFRHEVRSMAGLSHPFIAEVMDHGVISEMADEASFGRLRAGSPYLVMEYGSLGTMQDLPDGELPWPVVELVALAMLDALAHSHARGIIHRDLKPQNVLITETYDGWPGIRLADLGLAYVPRRAERFGGWHGTAGTPRYMAPEQIHGAWRDYSAMTDLYSLGCMVYELVSGEELFGGGNVVQIAKAHLTQPLPEFSAEVQVPKRLHQWLQVMTAKSPGERFQSAAAAARALRELNGAMDEGHSRRRWEELIVGLRGKGRPSSSKREPGEGEQVSGNSLVFSYTLESLLRGGSEAKESAPAEFELNNQVIPSQWEPRSVSLPSVRLFGTGRGLFGLRRIPVVGREKEQEHLWRRFRQVAERGKPTATLLQGPAGIGKDRLAEWLCKRAAELGVAQILRVFHEDAPDRVDGLAQAIKREFVLTDLTRVEAERRIEELYRRWGATRQYDLEAMVEIVSPGEGVGNTRIRFSSEKQRYLALARFLSRWSRRQPVIVWVNDAQWGYDTLSFLEYAFQEEVLDGPVYVVLTARDDLLAIDRAHREKIEAIIDQNENDALTLEPLDRGAMRRLVEELLFLEPAAANEVIEHAGGNPLHAREVVGAWVEDNVLEAQRSGYALRRGAKAAIPEDLTQVWRGVVDSVVDGDEDRRMALELGAILGNSVRRSTWRRAAAVAGVGLSNELIDELLRRKYIYQTPTGLVFSQNLFREALFESARQGDRWKRFCGIAAEAIDAASEGEGRVHERTGFLFLRAGQVVEGAKRLLRASKERRLSGDYAGISYLTAEASRALSKLEYGGEEAERIHVEVLIWQGFAYGQCGENEKARIILDQAMTMATALGDRRLQAAAAGKLGGILNTLSEVGEAEKQLAKAWAYYERANEEGRPVWDQYALWIAISSAYLARRKRQIDEGFRWVERGRVVNEVVGDPLIDCQLDFLKLSMRFVGGEALKPSDFDALEERCQQNRSHHALGSVYMLRAEAARRSDDLSRAEADYLLAEETLKYVDPGAGIVPRMNRILIFVARGEVEAAGLLGEKFLQDLHRKRRPLMRLFGLASILPMTILRDQRKEAGEVLDEIEAIMSSLPMQGETKDLTICLHAAVEQCSKEGQEPLRRRLEGFLTQIRAEEV